MYHLLLTCPRDLLCLIGVTVESRPQRRDPLSAVVAAIEQLGGPVEHHTDRFIVTLADPIDAVLAFGTLQRALPDYEIEVRTFVASVATVEMLGTDGEPIASAWREFQTAVEVFWWELAREKHFDFADDFGGLGWIRHFDRRHLFRMKVPAEIAQQRLPKTGLALWNVADRSILHIETAWSNYEISFERDADGWQVKDLASPFGLHVDGRYVGAAQRLQPGMIVLRPRPHAFVVLGAS